MIRLALVAALLALPAHAEENKEQACGWQAQVVAAIQQARLDRVKEADVGKTLTAAGPAWPENYNKTIPQLAPWVYGLKRRDLRTKDLGQIWRTQCLENWETIQAMQKQLSN